MDNNIEFIAFSNGLGFHVCHDGHDIGEITFLRVGLDKLMIDHTEIDNKYRNTDIVLNMVRRVCAIARQQHRKVISICPLAREMFNEYPEFDDVRLLNSDK